MARPGHLLTLIWLHILCLTGGKQEAMQPGVPWQESTSPCAVGRRSRERRGPCPSSPWCEPLVRGPGRGLPVDGTMWGQGLGGRAD